jgi:hypothetical protein
MLKIIGFYYCLTLIVLGKVKFDLADFDVKLLDKLHVEFIIKKIL